MYKMEPKPKFLPKQAVSVELYPSYKQISVISKLNINLSQKIL